MKIIGVDFGTDRSYSYGMIRRADEFGEIYSGPNLRIEEDRKLMNVIIHTDRFKIELVFNDNKVVVYDTSVKTAATVILATIAVNFEEALNFLLEMKDNEIISASAENINDKILNILLIG